MLRRGERDVNVADEMQRERQLVRKSKVCARGRDGENVRECARKSKVESSGKAKKISPV